MVLKTMDAAMLRSAFLSAAKRIEQKKEYINELNVFPVPDGDTGTNMTLTIMAAASDVANMQNPTMEQLCKAISNGSLCGARGNSGVILSQLLRGFTKEIRSHETIDVFVMSAAFTRAVESAYKAVMKPKEGTILTVAKGGAEKAKELVEETDDLIVFCDKIVQKMEEVLAKTPELLPVLKEAGVVDSGGQGLLEIAKGAYDGLLGKEVDDSSFSMQSTSQTNQSTKTSTKNISTAEITYGYCTEFIIYLEKDFSQKTEEEFKAFLTSLGDSIVVVSMDDIVKVHVHTNQPGDALQKALTYGSLSKIKIDNMREEHNERLRKEMEEETGNSTKENKQEPMNLGLASSKDGASGDSDGKEQMTDNPEAAIKQDNMGDFVDFSVEHKKYGLIAVSIGAGIRDIFHGLGVDATIEGGQTMNPSTEDILNAIQKINADHIFVLPNNKNIILAAQQAMHMTKDKNIIVLPTKNVPQGIAALVGFSPEADVDENEQNMREQMQMVKTGQVTYAVRDTYLNGHNIRQGNIMGMGEKGVLSVGDSIEDTTYDMILELIDEDSALISLYYGEDCTEDDAKALCERVSSDYPDIDVELHFGGQPVYYYVVSVE